VSGMRMACSTPASSVASEPASTMLGSDAGVAVGEATGFVADPDDGETE